VIVLSTYCPGLRLSKLTLLMPLVLIAMWPELAVSVPGWLSVKYAPVPVAAVPTSAAAPPSVPRNPTMRAVLDVNMVPLRGLAAARCRSARSAWPRGAARRIVKIVDSTPLSPSSGLGGCW
jgi:hypothetical protein